MTMDNHAPSHTPPVKPKGILKNAPPLPRGSSTDNHLTWDEENLAATEIGKDSLMKITEPKTPYVRYDAETDTVEGMSEIPPFSLEGQTPSVPNSPAPITSKEVIAEALDPGKVAELTNANTSANAAISVTGDDVRRASSTSSGRPGSMSRTSSRSTSFNLPNDDPSKAKFRAQSRSPEGTNADGEIAEDEELDPEAAAKHAAFVRARGRHYSNEAEAMKRAAQLMADEEEEEESSVQEKNVTDDTEEGEGEPMDDSTSDSAAETSPAKPNGILHK